MENLIGKKIKGFKFEAETPVYAESMDQFIGEIGEITDANSSFCRVKFENGAWNYPTSEIHNHLVEENQ